MAKIDFELLTDYSNRKLLTKKKHPTKDLWMFKYTPEVMMKGLWDDITLMCRGLVCDGEGNVVIWPMRKFFNHTEVQKFKQHSNKELQKMAQVYEQAKENYANVAAYIKWDGFLAMATKYEGEPLIVCSNSFSGEHQEIAEELIQKHPLFPEIHENTTFIFEIISFRKPIVVDYGKEERAEFLGLVNNKIGTFFRNTMAVRGLSISFLEEEMKFGKYQNKEGYVADIFSPDGQTTTVKFKYDKYVEVHKVVFGISETRILDLLEQDIDPIEALKIAPDELYDWIKETTNQYRSEVKKELELLDFISSDFSTGPKNGKTVDRKNYAIRVQKEYKDKLAPLMCLYDQKVNGRNNQNQVKKWIYSKLKERVKND